MIRNRTMFIALLSLSLTIGCRGQAPVTPPPTVAVSNTPASCPTNYTCGYIVSWATCTSATACPTPGNPGPGPYTALQTAATALATPNYTGLAPASGVYVAFVEQLVYTNLSPAWVGPPSPASTAQLIALYPGALGAPTATTTAALAPPLLPDAPEPQLVAGNAMPRMKRPGVEVKWR